MGEDEEAARHVRRKGSSADLSSARSRLPIRFSRSLFLALLSLSFFLLLSLSHSFSVHRRKCSYESLIPSVYGDRLAPFARAWVCVYTCTRVRTTRVAHPWKRHTPLPLLGHLPSPSSLVGREDDSFERSNASDGSHTDLSDGDSAGPREVLWKTSEALDW